MDRKGRVETVYRFAHENMYHITINLFLMSFCRISTTALYTILWALTSDYRTEICIISNTTGKNIADGLLGIRVGEAASKSRFQ